MTQLPAALRLLPLRDPVFQFGLAIRVLMVFLVIPTTYLQWFVPFLQNGVQGPLGPYATHLALGGDLRAFPYGTVMFILLAPFVALGTLLGKLTGLPLGTIGLGVAILVIDLALLAVLTAMKPKAQRVVLVLYWLSPIVIYICYWHGQLDIVPVFLLLLSLQAIFCQQPRLSGALMAAAVSSKLSVAIGAPFILLYLLVSRRRQAMLLPYIAVGAAVSGVLHLPVLLSQAGRQMVLGTPELDKIYDFAIPLADELQIYLLPVVYLLLLFMAWLIRRISPELLTALLGVAFLVIVLMTPASPGWYLWFVPFLTLSFVGAPLHMGAAALLFALLFAGFHLLRSQGAVIPLLDIDLREPLAKGIELPPHFMSILLSLLFAGGAVLCLLLLREGILRNDYFRLSRRPLMIGVAGDSGAGKDSLALSLTGLIGEKAVTHVSGDNYHLWDRHKPMWQVMTHLNPSANDLLKFRHDLLALHSGAAIRNRHYDHSKGRMTGPQEINSNEVIIATGLHALYDPELNSRFDVRIFLDMDDVLRSFLKVRRDVHDRSHTVASVLAVLRQRQDDRDRYIQPQAAYADAILTLMPLSPLSLETAADKAALPPLKLRAQLRHGTPYNQLVRILIGVCGLHVDVLASGPSERVDITVEGDLSPEDTALAAGELVAGLDDLLDVNPVWQGGSVGLIQLFVLNQISHSLKKRLQ